jgi:hypothetical protein
LGRWALSADARFVFNVNCMISGFRAMDEVLCWIR